MTKKSNLNIVELMESFNKKCRVKNLSEKTISTYNTVCGFFIRFVGEDYPVDEITEETIDDYILHLQDMDSINDVTINSYLRNLRALLYYAMDCDYMPSFKIKLIKADKKIKETYTDEELTRLLEKPDIKNCNFTEFKTWALENFLLATGMRISSAINVRIADVNFDEMTITIRKVKNRNQQIIPMSKQLATVVKEYLVYRGGNSEDYLFCNSYGEQSSVRTMQQAIQRYNIKRNVNKTSAHVFRHTFAKKFILAGGDSFRLQKMLGHSDLTVTKEYVAMFGRDLQKDFDELCPLDVVTDEHKRKAIQMTKKG